MPGSSGVHIHVHTDRARARIDDRLFGLHLEHIWNCVYPCIWVGPESSVPNTDGIRDETVAALAALRPTICKYPGGYFTDFYDWRDGIGPPENRRAREYPCVPGRREPNTFGTAEFVTFCRQIGAAPYLSVNTVSLQPAEAAHWVEYCNGTRDTFWANQRRAHGYEEPFDVRHWAIGNEAYWLHTPEAYAERWRHWVHCMMNVDPSIAVVVGGAEPAVDVNGPCNRDGRWAECFLEHTQSGRWWRSGWHSPTGGVTGDARLPEAGQVFYSFHPYFSADAECTREQYDAAFAELFSRLPSSIAQVVSLLDAHRGKAPRPRLVFDEYGLLHPGCSMDGNMTQPAPFWAALWLGAFFHVCFDHADAVGIATHPGPINMEHELLLLEDDRVIRTPSYHVFQMFREHGGAEALACEVSGVKTGEYPSLSCAASLAADGQGVTLSVVNLDRTRDVEARIDVGDRPVERAQGETLTSDDLHRANSAAEPDAVAPADASVRTADGGVACTFRAHSVTLLRVTPAG